MFEIIPNWHPVFVNFTIALLSTAVAFHVLTALMKPSKLRHELATLARWNLWLGAGFAIITVFLGFLAYNSVRHDTPSHVAMTIHRNWAIATLIIFLLLAAWSLWRHRAGRSANRPFLVLLLIGFVVLASTGWLGAEVVFRYGVGVKSLPKAELQGEGGVTSGHHHTHEHDAGAPKQRATGGNESATSSHDDHGPHVHEESHR